MSDFDESIDDLLDSGSETDEVSEKPSGTQDSDQQPRKSSRIRERVKARSRSQEENACTSRCGVGCGDGGQHFIKSGIKGTSKVVKSRTASKSYESDDSDIEVVQVFDRKNESSDPLLVDLPVIKEEPECVETAAAVNNDKKKEKKVELEVEDEMTDDEVKMEYEKIVTDYRGGAADSPTSPPSCVFCNKNFESVSSYNFHVVDEHIKQRMEDDLERAGWEAGQENCPACGKHDSRMDIHWGVHHRGIRRSVGKLTGLRHHYVAMKSAERGFAEYLQKKKSPKIDISISQLANETAKLIIQEDEKRKDLVDLAMEVEEEEHDVYISNKFHNNETSVIDEVEKVEEGVDEKDEISDEEVEGDSSDENEDERSDDDRSEDENRDDDNDDDEEMDEEAQPEQDTAHVGDIADGSSPKKKESPKAAKPTGLFISLPVNECEDESVDESFKESHSQKIHNITPRPPSANSMEVQSSKPKENETRSNKKPTHFVLSKNDRSEEEVKKDCSSNEKDRISDILSEEKATPTNSTTEVASDHIAGENSNTKVRDINSLDKYSLLSSKQEADTDSKKLEQKSCDVTDENQSENSKQESETMSSLSVTLKEIERESKEVSTENQQFDCDKQELGGATIDQENVTPFEQQEKERDTDTECVSTNKLSEDSATSVQPGVNLPEQFGTAGVKDPITTMAAQSASSSEQSAPSGTILSAIAGQSVTPTIVAQPESSVDKAWLSSSASVAQSASTPIAVQSASRTSTSQSVSSGSASQSASSANSTQFASSATETQSTSSDVKEPSVSSKIEALSASSAVKPEITSPAIATQLASSVVKQQIASPEIATQSASSKTKHDSSAVKAQLPSPTVAAQSAPSALKARSAAPAIAEQPTSSAAPPPPPPPVAGPSHASPRQVVIDVDDDDTDDEIEVIYEQKVSDKAKPVKQQQQVKKEPALSSFKEKLSSYTIPKKRAAPNVVVKQEPGTTNNTTTTNNTSGRSLQELVTVKQDGGDGGVRILDQRQQRDSCGQGEMCVICEKETTTREQLYLHLARTHFKDELMRRLNKSGIEEKAGEWKCPNCRCFCTSDLNLLVDHYAVYCLPFPVKKMYEEHQIQMKTRKLDSVCVFCEDEVEPHNLVNHLFDCHLHQVKYELGLAWSFLVLGITEMCCPLCNTYTTSSTSHLTQHYMEFHEEEFMKTLSRYRDNLREGVAVECVLCQKNFTTHSERINHLLYDHFKDNLLSECMASSDPCNYFACSNCEYKCNNDEDMVSHCGLEHRRLNFWLTDRLFSLAKKKDIAVTNMPKRERIENGDYKQLAKYLSDTARPAEESLAREVLIDTSNMMSFAYIKCSRLIKKDREGNFLCPCCPFTLKNETWMLSHVALKPHSLAKDYVGLKQVEKSRSHWCKLCSKTFSNKRNLQDHLAEHHFMDDIILETRPSHSILSGEESPKYLCNNCPHLGFMSHCEMVRHRTHVHESAFNLYKRTQVTFRELKCKLQACKDKPTFKDLADFKRHLGDHFQREMREATHIMGQSVVCKLCHNAVHQVGGEYDLADHVAVRHNYLDKVYLEEVKREALMEAVPNLMCELCKFSCNTVDEFLSHITYTHFNKIVQSWNWQGQIKCRTCMTSFRIRDFVPHAGMLQNNCNLSLNYYFAQLGQTQANSEQGREFSHLAERLRRANMERRDRMGPQRKDVPVRVYESRCLQRIGSNFVEDPVSCEVEFDIDIKENIVTTVFRSRLPMKSFKSDSKFDRLDDQSHCALCPLFRGHWEFPPGDTRAVKDAFLIHLANTHFKPELDKMFCAVGGREDYTCCDDTFNFQTLIGHLKENHDILQNMYKAVVPREIHHSQEDKRYPELQCITHFFPWLPGKRVVISRNTVAGSSGNLCKVCNNKVSGTRIKLYLHYVKEHFSMELQKKFANCLANPPYRCDVAGCKFADNEREEFLQHVAASHENIIDHLATKHQSKLSTSASRLKFSAQNSQQPQPAKVSSMSYFSPARYQCLVCQQDFQNPVHLSQHINNTRHVNYSWALHSNSSNATDAKRKGFIGTWFQQLDLKYRCSPCVKNAGVMNSVPNFTSIPEVFQHICMYHRDYFKDNYPRTVTSFIICRVCNCFINLSDVEGTEEEDKMRVEFNHYLEHGQVFLLYLGMLDRRVDSFICMLCNNKLKSEETYRSHLLASHVTQITNAFRDFSFDKSDDSQKLDRCCICKQRNTSKEHLASHSRQILETMGLIKANYKDHKSSKMTCRCCNFIDKNCIKIIDHFSKVHSELFKFILEKFDEQNFAMDESRGLAVGKGVQHTTQSRSLLKSSNTRQGKHFLCCNHSFADNLYDMKKHLITKHFYEEILNQVYDKVHRRSMCPECGWMDKELDLHYWSAHIVSTGRESVSEPEYDGRSKNFKCSLCDQRCSDINSYHRHVYWHHKDADSKQQVKKELDLKKKTQPYAFCPEKNCRNRNNSEQHLVLHHAIDHEFLDHHLKSIGKLSLLEMVDRYPSAVPKLEPEEVKEEKTSGEFSAMKLSQCPVCKNTMSEMSNFQRSSHFLKHFRRDLENYVTRYFQGNTRVCGHCHKKCQDEQTLHVHLGSYHGLFDNLIRDYKNKMMPAKASKADSYSNQFARFLESNQNRAISSSQAKAKTTTSPVKSGEKCKLCPKVFEEYGKDGTKKSELKVSELRFQHYLTHFRQDLIDKYPQTFVHAKPLYCAKCPFNTADITKSDHNHVMLLHVARCNNELDQLIEAVKPKVQPSVANKEPKGGAGMKKQMLSANILSLDHCLVCQDKISDLRNHYTRHFFQHFKTICKTIIDNSDLDRGIVCPFKDCRLYIERDCDLENEFLFKFFRHLGFTHNLIQTLFYTSKPLSLVSIDKKRIVKRMSQHLWVLKKGACLVCGKVEEEAAGRLEHYRSHAISLFKTFDTDSLECPVTECRERMENNTSLQNHLLYSHFNAEVKSNLLLRPDGSYQCSQCPTTSRIPEDIVTHLVNEEDILLLRLMMHGSAQSKKNNVDKAKKADTVDYKDMECCVLCGNFVNRERFTEHLHQRHFKDYFIDKVNAVYENKDTLVCNICQASVEKGNMPKHLAEAHSEARIYYNKLQGKKHVEATKSKIDLQERIEETEDVVEVEDEPKEVNTELTTLGEGRADYEKMERELKHFLRNMAKSQEIFVQNAPCYMFSGKLSPCQECRKIQEGASYASSGNCCCFEGFRKLRFVDKRRIIVAGYLSPTTDPRTADIQLWTPKCEVADLDLSLEEAFLILEKVGDLLCDVLVEENRVKEDYTAMNCSVVWKRPHQGVREMCDVCSTSIFNIHFTCSTCGVLVCVDCMKARKQGTKYKSINALTRQTQTKRRFKEGLDMNLWPLCLNNQIHDLDQLIMTQMSPGTVTDTLLEDIHSIRKQYNLSAGCSCCVDKDHQDQQTSLSSHFDLMVINTCPECGVDLSDCTLELRKLHLAGHIKQTIISKMSDTKCDKCSMDGENLLLHRALCHEDVSQHFCKTFIKFEEEVQEQCSLKVDNHMSCSICLVNFNKMDKVSKRNHYLNHLSALVYSNTRAAPPFSCEDCKHVEFNRNRLMLHRAIVHKHLDSALASYLAADVRTDCGKTVKRWQDIPLCGFCNERLSDKSEVSKRGHYYNHLRQPLEKIVHQKCEKVLMKEPPYRCQEVGCYTVLEGTAAASRFVRHMAVSHKFVDPLIQDLTRSIISNHNKEDDLLDFFSLRCHICDQEFDQTESQDSIKKAKMHYHIHFKNCMEEKYKDILDEHKIPIHCPFEGCQFNTAEFDSDQFGHHKKKLISHLGTFHDLFRKFITDTTLSRKKYDASQKFLKDVSCKFCFATLPDETEMKTEHFFIHFRGEIENEFGKEMFSSSDEDDSHCSCPFCDTRSKAGSRSEAFKEIVMHMGVHHGIFDKKISDYSRNLNYDTEVKCRVCSKDFRGCLAKNTTMKKHYAQHFGDDIRRELPDWTENHLCPFCKENIISDEAMILHIGTQHGYFCRYIEQVHWQNSGEDHVDAGDKEADSQKYFYSQVRGVNTSQCLLCGDTIHLDKSKIDKISVAVEDVEQEMKTQALVHLVSHVAEFSPDFKNLKCGHCQVYLRTQDDWLHHVTTHREYTLSLVSMFVPSSNHADMFHLFVPYSEQARLCYPSLQKDGDSEYKFLHTKLNSCPKCSVKFSSVNDFTVKLHLLRHYAESLAKDVDLSDNRQCAECDTSFTSDQSYFLHLAVAHSQINKYIPQNYLQSEEAARRSRFQINRFTAPMNSNRYKTICLICGSDDVLLASQDRVAQEAANPVRVLEEGLAVHLVCHHLDTDVRLQRSYETGMCHVCQVVLVKPQDVVPHIAAEHQSHLCGLLATIFGPVDEDSLNVKLSDFFVGFENKGYQEMTTINIDQIVTNAQKVTTEKEATPVKAAAGVKRQSEPGETSQAKRAKVSEEKETVVVLPKSVKCEICLFHVSADLIDQHRLTQHVWSEIELNLTSSTCPDCNQNFRKQSELVKHVGLTHKKASLITSRLDPDMKGRKRQQFHEKLSRDQPDFCKICGINPYQGKKKFGDLFLHYIEKHKDVFTFVEEDVCRICNIKIVAHNSDMAHFIHRMVEHTRDLVDSIDDHHREDWVGLGHKHCECCAQGGLTRHKFKAAAQKREHLLEHFTDSLLKSVLQVGDEFCCPLVNTCKFKSNNNLAVLQHWAVKHKAVDTYLPKKLLMQDGMRKTGLEGASFCGVCLEPVWDSDLLHHTISHFFVEYMQPRLSSTDCVFKKCGQIDTSVYSPYGAGLKHVGDHHSVSLLTEFIDKHRLDSSIKTSTVLFQLKCKIVELLQGNLCIYCCQSIKDCDAGEHMKLHTAKIIETKYENSTDFGCDLCDGFPEFSTRQEMVEHDLNNHTDVMQYLKALDSVLRISQVRYVSCRNRDQNSQSRPSLLSCEQNSQSRPSLLSCEQNSQSRSSLLGKRKADERLVGCHLDNCSLYDEDKFYEHYSRHFYPFILYNLASKKVKNTCPLECQECGTRCVDLDHLVLHFGKNHGHIMFYYRCSKVETSLEEVPSFLLEDDRCILCRTSLFTCSRLPTCQTCDHMYSDSIHLIKKIYIQVMNNNVQVGCDRSSSMKGSNKNPLKSYLKSALEKVETNNEENETAPDLRSLLSMNKMEADKKHDTTVDEDLQFRNEPGMKSLSSRRILTREMTGRDPGGGEADHSWLCDGRLLFLHDAVSPHNIHLFSQQWSRGQPVIIGNSDQYLNRKLWTPKAFMNDFENSCADLVNTLTGRTVPNQPLLWFWKGFTSVSQRLVDSQGTPMLLKLKDWPPDGDIAENLPKRYDDLIHDFPIKSYTLREGSLNLASYMPDYYLKPELGPKMYIAYGNALYNERASTNLHLDMSDAVNLLVYVGLPDDCSPQENIKCVLDQIDEAGCDIIMRRRVREQGLLPGAIWHIFHPADTNKIRDFLIKVAVENGKKLDPHDDPIHDQSTYLDSRLRQRLYTEYGVHGYTIIQCAGDTVFIPAGACHQVRNLHNCIKIAEDFVSPQLATNCLHLTQEFRHLTEHHTNHEDKLQIKNIIYHSVKTAVARINNNNNAEKEAHPGNNNK